MPGTSLEQASPDLVTLDVSQPIWDRFFSVAPLVVIGTREPDGGCDLAPKHMATPLGWGNYFGFVCTPQHATCRNVNRTGEFTVSIPGPDQVLLSSLAASPRCGDGEKPALKVLPTFRARQVDGELLSGGVVFLECRLMKIVDGFGSNCLIAGRIIAASAVAGVLRSDDTDDQDLIRRHPLLTYLPPGRFAAVSDSNSFPFPAGFSRGTES